MPRPEPPKSDAELRAEQQNIWNANLAIRAAKFKELDERLMTMPDVIAAPNPELPWSSTGIHCACGGQQFSVTRWVTINGIKYRFEAKCVTCDKLGTYDWQSRNWIT